jgi:hypothetical protein
MKKELVLNNIGFIIIRESLKDLLTFRIYLKINIGKYFGYGFFLYFEVLSMFGNDSNFENC